MFKKIELVDTKEGLCLHVNSEKGVSWIQCQNDKECLTDGVNTWNSMEEVKDIEIVRKFIGLCYRSYSIDIQIVKSPFFKKLADECVLNGSKKLKEEVLKNKIKSVQTESLIQVLPELELEIGKKVYQELLERGCSKIDIMFYAGENMELKKLIEKEAEKEVLI